MESAKLAKVEGEELKKKSPITRVLPCKSCN